MRRQSVPNAEGSARLRAVIAFLVLLAVSWSYAGTASATCALCTPVDSVFAEIDAANQPVINTPLSTADGPSVQLGWTNPPGFSTPGRVAVYRGISGAELEEIWACEGSCPATSYLDATDLLEGVSYDYQVVASDGLGTGGGSDLVSVTTALECFAERAAIRHKVILPQGTQCA